MNPTSAGILTLLVGLLVALTTLWFIARSRQQEPAAQANQGLYKARTLYFVILSLCLLAGLTATLGKVPYGQADAANSQVVVNVNASMYNWEMVKVGAENAGELVIPAQKDVEFRVTGLDVNHGFGVYDADGHLLTQTQAMPGYTNRLVYNFAQPGVYHVLCLEYCGMMHPKMNTTFRVE
ncbi:MAG: cytochrome C oxidase subunit II [Deltaproteobacteria bacterium]|nr:cytochrome C oxidase subunit II [Deltaproteobacteria bacterium]